MKKSFCLLIIIAMSGMFTSCNTFIGLGRDVQSFGRGMQNTGYGRKWNAQEQLDQNYSTQPARY